MTTRILLAEYGKMQHLRSERTLRKAGYEVLSAPDGEEALRLARITFPDIILLDMLLPRVRGREVMRALKKDPATAHIPILVFSSLPQTNERWLKNEGAAGYFEKSRLVGDVAKGEKELVGLIEEILQETGKSKG